MESKIFIFFFYFVLTLLAIRAIIRYKQKGVVVMDKKKLLEMTRGVDIEDLVQTSQPEEREVVINIQYGDYGGWKPEVWIYTNNSTIMRRILRKGHMPTKVDFLQARPDMPWSMDFRLPIDTLGDFVKLNIFKIG